MDKSEAAKRTANALYKLGPDSLSIAEEEMLKDREFSRAVQSYKAEIIREKILGSKPQSIAFVVWESDEDKVREAQLWRGKSGKVSLEIKEWSGYDHISKTESGAHKVILNREINDRKKGELLSTSKKLLRQWGCPRSKIDAFCKNI